MPLIIGGVAVLAVVGAVVVFTKKRKQMRKKISTILILVGILMIVIPQGLKYYSRQVENKSIQKFKSELQDKSESQDEVEDNY